MNQLNKLTLSMLSVALMAGLTACNGSLKSDSKDKKTVKEQKLEAPELSVQLESVAEDVVMGDSGVASKVKIDAARKYLISHVGQSGQATQVSFKLNDGRFGNGKATVEGIEYSITDECSDTSCVEVGALITKIEGSKTEQSAYLFKLAEGKYELVCSVKGTKMDLASEALGIEKMCPSKEDIVNAEDAEETL